MNSYSFMLFYPKMLRPEPKAKTIYLQISYMNSLSSNAILQTKIQIDFNLLWIYVTFKLKTDFCTYRDTDNSSMTPHYDFGKPKKFKPNCNFRKSDFLCYKKNYYLIENRSQQKAQPKQ